MRILSIPVLLLFAAVASAELPSPRLDRITPLGGAAGSSVELEIVGADLEEADRMLFDHPGIKAEHVKDRKFKVSIAADVPSGTYDARVVGKYGVSSPRLFAVSHDLVEVQEKEPNDDAAAAQAVEVNSVVNGTSDQGRDDVFRFPAKKGQRIVVECFAQRLDSQLDGTMTLTDKSGRLLASNRGYHGRDPLSTSLPQRRATTSSPCTTSRTLADIRTGWSSPTDRMWKTFSRARSSGGKPRRSRCLAATWGRMRSHRRSSSTICRSKP